MPEQGRQHELESLRMQAEASSKVAEHLVALNGNMEKLEKTVSSASDSSDRLAKALNWLTFALVVVGALAIVVPFLKA
jgi:hypothetical protein